MRDSENGRPAANAAAVAEGAARLFIERDRGTRMLGCTLVSVEPGRATVRLAVEERHLNSADVCHGGIVFALADSALGFASCSHGMQTLAQQASITWLRPAHRGDVLEADAREVSRAGRTGIYDIAVVNQRGETVALFRGMTRALDLPVGAPVGPRRD
jgi:acyl-CoA thioesterase